MSEPALLAIDDTPLDIRIEAESLHSGCRFFWMSLHAHDIGDFPLRMCFGFALPAGDGPFPALLHLHGGAQSARREVALAWAAQGYAALCPDWSVPAGYDRPEHPTLWPAGFPRIDDLRSTTPENAAIGHIVRAVRRCISFLCAHPQVIPGRIGMCGISWGGLMTWLVNGTDTRLRCAIPVYGCGLAPDRPAPDHWHAVFQPALFAETQHAPLFFLNGTHDFFGNLPTAEDLLARLSVPCRRLYVPNEDHGLSPAARESVRAWLNTFLRGDGHIPPEPVWEDPHALCYHADSAERSSVFRKWTHPALPTFGSAYVTRSYADGFSFSSPLRQFPPALRAASPRAYAPARDGLEPLFLRWEHENLRIHLPETGHLIHADEGGVRLEPPADSFRIFLRIDTPPPPNTRALRLRWHSPLCGNLGLQLYTSPGINDACGWTHPELRIETGAASFDFIPENLRGLAPAPSEFRLVDTRILRLFFRATPPKPAAFRLLAVDWI